MRLKAILLLLTATLLVPQALATNCFPRPETYLVQIAIFWYLSCCLFSESLESSHIYIYIRPFLTTSGVLPVLYWLCFTQQQLQWEYGLRSFLGLRYSPCLCSMSVLPQFLMVPPIHPQEKSVDPTSSPSSRSSCDTISLCCLCLRSYF